MVWRRFRWGIVGVLLVCAAACGTRAERVNTDCRWTHDPSTTLDWRDARDERHLSGDAQIAVELAIRYADVHRGVRSPYFIGPGEYAAARERCLASLIETIGKTHAVDPSRVRALVRRRPAAYDLAVVILPMVVLFWFATDLAVRRIFRRFATDERIPRLVSLFIASLVLDVLVYQVGTVWSFFAEERVRLHTTHLSYRAFYLPWIRHTTAVLVAGILLFWCAVLVRIRRGESGGEAVY
jgi:hypothetical protein